jgi:hypothetical protein
MTTAQVEHEIRTRFGADAGFIANVISTQHRHSARKLRGLLGLLRGGYEVRIAQFNIDVLLVNGNQRDWSFLETTTARFPWNHSEEFGR